MKRSSLRWIAGVLFLAGVGVGWHGAGIARDGTYARIDRLRDGQTKTCFTRGPEAVAWGWTLISGAVATLAWAALLAFPPVPRPASIASPSWAYAGLLKGRQGSGASGQTSTRAPLE